MCGLFLSYQFQAESMSESLVHRGPDQMTKGTTGAFHYEFHRLKVMAPEHQGAEQPFTKDAWNLMCNGEIYNYLELAEKYSLTDISSDCSVILPLFLKLGIKELLKELRGEFAFVLWNSETEQVIAARDPLGIRPLFIGTEFQQKGFVLASEVKAIKTFSQIQPLPPHHFFDGEKLVDYDTEFLSPTKFESNQEAALKGIKSTLEKAVIDRLEADTPMGFLLSGGLDSSLVCAIAQRHSKKPIRTFAIGMKTDAIDLKYAKQVAEYLGTDHTEVIMTEEDVLAHLPELIEQLETFDITTIRASMGMSLVCRWIKENTDIKSLMTGEVSDELFGYKYTDYAPSPAEFQKEAKRRIEEIYLYDVLRADRSLSFHSLEARVPFSDYEFVKFVMAIDPKLKMNWSGKGKFLLRKAFAEDDYLPETILWREKAAFSDAVGHSMVDILKAYAESKFTDEEYESSRERYSHGTPVSKESLLYRDLFEEFYPGKGKLIPGFWLPNQDWPNCQVNEPSARVLPNYGLSGA